MFCPSCGARNLSTARSCAECDRPLPAARAPVARPPAPAGPLAPPAATEPDRPSAAPAEPPRILRRPAPLSPAPVDIVPNNPSPPPIAAAAEVDPSGPTLIRRPPEHEERMFMDVTLPLPRRETPAPVEGAAVGGPEPARQAPPSQAPTARSTPASPLAPRAAPTQAPVPRPVTMAAPPPAPAAHKAPPSPRKPPKPPPPTPPLPFQGLARDDSAGASPATGSTAAVPKPELALPPAVLVLGSGWRLALARVVDGVATAAIAAGLLLGALSAVGVRAAVQPVVDRSHADPVTMAAVLLAVPFCAVALYQAVTVLFLGGTLGCRLAGLRVVRQSDGARPGAVRALVRGLASALGTLLFGSGPLWGLLIDRRRRGLGDVVTGSVVVRAAGGDRA